MKCNLCQQSNYVSLHGRLLCGGCGNRAGERLEKFQSRPAQPRSEKIYSDNILDLSRQKKTDRSAPQVLENSKNTSVASLDLRAPAATQAHPVPPEPTPPRNLNPTTMQPQATYPLKAGRENFEQQETAQLQKRSSKRPGSRFKLPNLSFPGNANSPWMRLATVTAGMLLLVGYVTYLNYPNIAVRVAASRANIDASMPGYLPGGYGFDGPVAYGTGKLTLTFSGSDGTIALSQSTTRWDSESLLDNHVRLQTSKYSTYQENGLTIYTYDNRFAAWVNGGIMYQIEASEYLNPEDIVKMASSL